jgi:plasmid maintenance system antidote protein VapI
LTYDKVYHNLSGMKLKQKNISRILGISQPLLSMVINGRRDVSWPLAVRLTELFPGKTIQQWKDATPEDLRRAFAQLPTTKQGEAA